MKKKLIMGAMALLSVFAMTLTSCSDDNDSPSNGSIEIKDVEFGHHNNGLGTIGKDLHLECKIKSSSKIKAIRVSIIKDANNKVEKVYNSGKYIGVLNTTFHEHIDLPATLAEGEYKGTITVTNTEGTVKTVNAKITLKKKEVDPNMPKISDLKVNTMESTANGKVTFTANIETKDPVDEIEIEFHGDKEYEMAFDEFKGKSGKFVFSKGVTLPADCKPGTYHIHFTVKDNKKRKATEEIEGFVVK